MLQILLAAFLLLIAAAIWLHKVGEKEQAEFMLHVITSLGVFSAVITAVYGGQNQTHV